jgi:hypothetical protein
MRYSFKKRVGTRVYRYNRREQILEHVEKDILGEWVVSDYMDLSPKEWKNRKIRKAALETFDEKISDFEFGQKYNIVLA